MAAHSSILAWGIPWTEELGGLQSMRLQSWTQLSTHACTHIRTWDECVGLNIMMGGLGGWAGE